MDYVIGSLTVIFAFMAFMIILNKGHLWFFSVFSLLLVVAISLGVGYGIANFVWWLGGKFIKIILIVLIASIVYLLVKKR